MNKLVIQGKQVAILQTGSGNITSLVAAFKRLGAFPLLVESIDELSHAERLVIPGQGRFGSCANELQLARQYPLISKWIESGRSILGVCVGMQLLFEGSEENPSANGLGLIHGRLTKIEAPRVPLMGWLNVEFVKGMGLPNGDAYFVNSYCAKPDAIDDVSVAALSNYYGEFASAVRVNNALGLQFHPEKSADYGMELLQSWLKF